MDEKVYFYKELPFSYRDPDNFIDSGCHGKIYKISDDKIFKYLDGINIFENNYEYLVSQSSLSFVFPDTLVYLRDKLVGYIAMYVDGISYKNMSTTVLLDDFLNTLVVLEEEIRKKSMDSMHFNDLIPDNIMWSNDKKLKVIDTDLYGYNNSFYELHELYFENLANSNLSILTKFFDNYHFDIDSDILNKYFKLCMLEGRMGASKFLGYLIDYLGEKTGNSIITIQDIKDNLLLVRKR